ncbi:MAG: FxLYD domain-containing protein [Candidatus Bathyarchaeia archaeon]
MKKIITAVILVVLIVATFSMLLSAPSVKAATSEAKVVSYTWYEAPADTVIAGYIDDLVAVGEIQNVGSNVIGYVDIRGTAYNSTGHVLNSASGTAYGNNLLPDQKAPFYLDFNPQDSVTQDNTYVSSVTNVTVFVSYVNNATVTPYSGLSIVGPNAIDSGGTYSVTGTVQNTGDETVGNVFVVTTFYNTSGTVVSMNYSEDFLSTSFAPGASAPFTATPTDNSAQLSSEIANYSTLIQSSPIATSATPTPSASPSPTATLSAQPTQSPAPSSSGLIYAAVGAIVVVVVVLAALLLLRMRHKNAQFEPPPPPPPPPPP